MFEKEAKKWVENNLHSTEEDYIKAFQDGAEYGFQKGIKAKVNTTTISDCPIKDEWHYVKDGDLPKENKLYFVAIKDNGLAIAYFNGRHWETKFNLGDFGHLVETVIAWCEIPTFDKE